MDHAVTTGRTIDARDAETSKNLAKLFWRIRWRIMPVLLLSYCISWLDRVNVGFSQLQMGKTLGMDPAQFGFAAGIFFLTYSSLEVPSNLLFQRLGARKTFLRIMLLWGITVVATGFVTSPTQFYIARLLLGAFEAGFLPGVVLYLTYWFPSSQRARAFGLLFLANGIASAIAGPITTGIMVRFDGSQGLHGWQWVFVMQGLPACVMGVICYFVLSDTPQQAAWLSSSERARLTHVLDLDREPEHGPNRGVAAALLRDPIVWVFAFMYFSSYSANVMFTYWMPTMLKESGIAKLLDIGFLSVLPWISGIAGLLIMNFSSDYFRERRWHMALAFTFTIAGLLAAVALNKSPIILVICFSVANFGGMACGSLFWTMPTTYLSQRAAPAGIAMISTLGSLCGFFIPIALGIVRNATGGFTAGVLLIAAMMTIALVLIMRVLPASAVRVWAEK